MASGIAYTTEVFLEGQMWCFHATGCAFSFKVAFGTGIQAVDLPLRLKLVANSGS
jgi:hypothetical protein